MKTSSVRQFPPSVSYREGLLERIKTSADGGAGYLNLALEDSPEVFLIALKDVVDAHGGMTQLARKTGIHRVSLHSALSEAGNPRFLNLMKVFDALGIRVIVTQKSKPTPKRRARAG